MTGVTEKLLMCQMFAIGDLPFVAKLLHAFFCGEFFYRKLYSILFLGEFITVI